ncbi:hypothetical protein BDM02DRAFT_3189560 [Thelephora ganbajun]|uniref:Uncharacterized protein n=1 Tax=Thelephora ganbajun TaxID=370292 RepID=A0ACB6Z8D3_THEGA|nr:hypothetical protein BDM02DRAFT_3189560 [Thelephora ganbajun]
MAATLPFCEALNEGIVSGTLVDTKIILFSRRDISGSVRGPKALYASSHVLKSVPYFNDLLFGNFSEARLKDFDDDFGGDESAEDYGYYSDSDLEDDENEKPTPQEPTHDVSSTGSPRSSHLENHTELSNKGKIVRIPDVAFVTFQAFIFYLYTGQIEFAPLGPQGNRGSRTTELQTSHDDEIPRPSPKSVYRLADKYDTPTLKALALSHIRRELKNCDIVEETFSEFTSRYDDIKMACVTQLVSALRNDTAEKATWMKFCEVIDCHFKGDLHHVTDTLSLLWRTVNKDDDITTTSNSTSPFMHINSPASRNALLTAMVRSIREGVFFDQKYWTRHSRKGSTLKPVYFSSMIAGDAFEVCTVHPNSQSIPTKGPVGEAEAESDYESDSTETGESMPASTQDSMEENGETRTVLSPGPHSAWRSLFFYKCTGQISFAPLRSQGVDSRLRYILERTTADAPPPCSPKSIYVLANLVSSRRPAKALIRGVALTLYRWKLNIQPLRDLAFKDVKSKLSEDNIVEEFFSCVTAK